MKARILFVAVFFLAVIGSARAQTDVVLSQKFKIIPFAMPQGAKLAGDHVCKFFLLTHYGSPSSPAWIGFNHQKDSTVVSEVIKGKDVKVTVEDNDGPFATKVEDNDGTTWTIHISKLDFDAQADCLKDLPRN